MQEIPVQAWAALVGLIGGVVLGLAARLGDFCTLGAIEQAVYGGDQRRLRLWGVIVGTAVIGTGLLGAVGVIDTAATIYHQTRWLPLASVLGGGLFGYGMALAGNCGFGALVRFGGGDLRSMVVLVVMAIFGFIALSGPLAPVRVALFPQEAAVVAQGPAAFAPPLLVALVVGGACWAWALAHGPLRESRAMLGWGVAAGAAVVWCLAATSILGQQSLGAVAPEGPSYTAPLGRTLIFLMTSTAGGVTFSVGSVVGVALGAMAGSTYRGLFRWEACEDPRELGRQLSGAAMMGVGGVVAMGCSVGQGITATATLAWSGPVTLAAIGLGAVAGLRRLIGGFEPD